MTAARGHFNAKSAVIKRSIVIDGHKTSVSLEDEFWDGLRELAEREAITLSTLVGNIDRVRTSCNLSSAIRVFVFNRLRARHDTADTQHPGPTVDVAAVQLATD